VISDFVPLFGYRRKSYLVAANVVATGAFLWAAQVTQPGELALVILMTSFAMAISSTVCGALLVENGQRFGESGKLVNQQWLWFNIAAMAAAIGGGGLVQWLSPTSALHAAAFIVALTPLALVFGTWWLIDEHKRSINVQELNDTFRNLLAAFRRRELWIVALFLFLYYFSPGFSTPLYYHMTDDLKFSQGYIGILGSISSGGWIVGALLYRKFLEGLSSKNLLNLSIALGTLTSFLLLSSPASAAILNFFAGFTAMLATVATLTLAANYSPQRSEGFAFAMLMSIINLAVAVADNVGAFLYERAFHNSLTPLIIVSASFTAFALPLVPLLRLGDKRQGPSV
jgi:predicted MFS family arabinose efflux permease